MGIAMSLVEWLPGLIVMGRTRENEPQISSEAVQDAMTNELILEYILKRLNSPTLFHGCRRVNRQWNRLAMKILKKRTDTCLKLNARTDLEWLELCIRRRRRSSDFPFLQIELECNWAAFKLNSSKRWLKVDFRQPSPSLFTRLRLSILYTSHSIISQMPTKKHFRHAVPGTLSYNMSLRKLPRAQPHWFYGYDNVVFPNLERLTSIAIGDGMVSDSKDLGLLLALLQACPSLQRIENFTKDHLPALSAATGRQGGRANKSIQASWRIKDEARKCPTCPSGTLTLSRAAVIPDSNVNDDALKIYWLRSLGFHRDTLRVIQVRTPVVGSEDYSERWPQLSKLATLREMTPYKCPHSVKKNFAAGKILQFYDTNNDKNFRVEKILPYRPTTSLTQLEVVPFGFSLKDWACISTSLPNVRQVFLNFACSKIDYCNWNFYDDLELDKVVDPWSGVRGFKNLETLILGPIKLPEVNLDAFLTGIPLQWIKRNRANPEIEVPDRQFIDLDDLRHGESLPTLPGLKELVIHCTMSDSVTVEDVERNPPITRAVAMQYGFSMVPADLQVRFLYDRHCKNAHLIEEALRPVAERVTFGHWNGDWPSPATRP